MASGLWVAVTLFIVAVLSVLNADVQVDRNSDEDWIVTQLAASIADQAHTRVNLIRFDRVEAGQLQNYPSMEDYFAINDKLLNEKERIKVPSWFTGTTEIWYIKPAKKLVILQLWKITLTKVPVGKYQYLKSKTSPPNLVADRFSQFSMLYLDLANFPLDNLRFAARDRDRVEEVEKRINGFVLFRGRKSFSWGLEVLPQKKLRQVRKLQLFFLAAVVPIWVILGLNAYQLRPEPVIKVSIKTRHRPQSPAPESPDTPITFRRLPDFDRTTQLLQLYQEETVGVVDRQAQKLYEQARASTTQREARVLLVQAIRRLKAVRPQGKASQPQAAVIRNEVVTTVRHIFLRDIEDRRLQIDELLPDRVDKVMAKEVIRALLVLGRRQAINESQYLPFGFVHHRVASRYQDRSDQAFDFAVFRQTLSVLESEGVIVVKEKPGRKEKLMYSLRSVPRLAKNPKAARVVAILNQLKQDASAGRLV